MNERAGSFTIWFTGLSGSGKTTVARLLADRLHSMGRQVEVLDGDILRAELSPDLGFSKRDRDENVRRIGWMCQLLNRHGVDAVVAVISPYQAARDEIRRKVEHLVEVYMECPLEVLVARDVKHLYRRALAGELDHFSGVSDPYEPPLQPDVVCHSDGTEFPEESAEKVIATLRAMRLLPPDVAGEMGTTVWHGTDR